MQQLASDLIRRNLEQLLRQTGADMKKISAEVLGKNHSYLFGFLKRGAPADLSFESRLRLTAYFNVRPALFFSIHELDFIRKVRNTDLAPSANNDLSNLIQVASDVVASIRRAQNQLQQKSTQQESAIRAHYIKTISQNAQLLAEISKKIAAEAEKGEAYHVQ